MLGDYLSYVISLVPETLASISGHDKDTKYYMICQNKDILLRPNNMQTPITIQTQNTQREFVI